VICRSLLLGNSISGNPEDSRQSVRELINKLRDMARILAVDLRRPEQG
jgi:hypothetical protein